jgi:curved DNA-binding protein CbpA
MDFENDNVDPYQILRVPFGASIEVCKATYKSLTKIYHPDVFVGEKAYAEKRMAELNAAFEYLNNAERKTKFDEAGEKPNQKDHSQQYEPENDSEEFNKASKILQQNWEFACKYHPELLKLHEDLRELNSQTAFLFMAVIVEEKLYEKASELARYLEDQFLSSKFGEDPDIKKIAKQAVLSKEQALSVIRGFGSRGRVI